MSAKSQRFSIAGAIFLYTVTAMVTVKTEKTVKSKKPGMPKKSSKKNSKSPSSNGSKVSADESSAARRIISPDFNTEWFQHQFQMRDLSQRKIAKLMGIDPSALSFIVTRRRRLALDEANSLAAILGLPIEEILVQAGINVSGGVSRDATTVEGWVDGDLRVNFGQPKGPPTAPYPFSEKGIRVVRCQTVGSKYDGLDGALIYFRPAKKFDPATLGQICLVQVRGEKGMRLAVPRKGYRSGTYNLSVPMGDVLAEGIIIESTSQVIWIKT